MKPGLRRIIALGPGGESGVGIVAAAARAGALGIIDLCGMEKFTVMRALGRLRHLGVSHFGVRVSVTEFADQRWIEAMVARGTFVLSGEDSGAAANAVDRLRAVGHEVLVEVSSLEGAREAAGMAVDGVIVVGEEAGGLVGDQSAFVLMQAALGALGVPVWVRGGVGCRVASGCVAAGAAGVVLDGALLLARESRIGSNWRARIARCDGSDTTIIKAKSGSALRVLTVPGSAALTRLRMAAEVGGATWDDAVRADVGWAETQCPPVGQDTAFASELAGKYVTTGGIIGAVERAIGEGIAAARGARPLCERSAMAAVLGTRYPVLQGPMTRVSDVAGFAGAVAEGGGLPFVAVAMMSGEETCALLQATAAWLGDRPWGVGILGFVAPALRAEQLAAVREARPPFALIAGGRPDQAAVLESEGVRTFLHVPSPVLLDQYIREGCRRFVLEGRECGGHVGPRSSFVLWEQALTVVQAAVERGVPADELSLVFAGGIHDARSAATVSAIAGPVAMSGVTVGILAGTGYLFTREAVETGAIVSGFQEEVLRCGETVLLESGPGHQVRVSGTAFVERFREERLRLVAERRSAEEIRHGLEALNVGRLRVATKGLDRLAERELTEVDPQYQRENGLYMVGQAATLRNKTTTIVELHANMCEASAELLDRAIPELDSESGTAGVTARPSDVAIIGMAAVLPGASGVQRFWSNTLRGVDSVTEVPADRWDWRLYYDPDPKAPDKIVSKWGGFVPDVAFDPLKFGMPPTSLPSIEPAQLLALEVVRKAIADAGYANRPFAREKTAVVLGMGGGAAQVAMGYAFRSYLPMLDTASPGSGQAALEACRGLLPEWTEDSFPGFLLNVTAGRIANRMNLGGSNYTVDAACGSSLAAAAVAIRELESGTADLVILGGVDTVQNPFTYLAFSKTQAFSPHGRCRPFDSSADGIVISEGVAALVLKRLADAERDGDRIYAVIKGIGSSSDGRARGLTAPVVEGQIRAVERAYAKAGISPATVGYVEAHGTGTALGDVVEVESLSRVLREAGAARGGCVVGSVKSLIGHTKCAAGLAGLINASLALHHRLIPPTIGVETPNPKLDWEGGPLRLCTEAQPWLHGSEGTPRRAGVSAFGFGGTNFHAVLEAYDRNLEAESPATLTDWPVELLVWETAESADLMVGIDRLVAALEAGARPALRDLANTLIEGRTLTRARLGSGSGRVLAIVTNDHADLLEKLKLARTAVASGRETLEDARGVWYAAEPRWSGASVAFSFPGQGAQAPGMSRELSVIFPEVRDAFEEFQAAIGPVGGVELSSLIFPGPLFDDAGRAAARRALQDTEVAQPAIGAACVGLLRLMKSLGIEADVLGGHSYGELVALHAAGTMTSDGLAELSRLRGRLMKDAERGANGAMAAILASPDVADGLVRNVGGTNVANWNGPRQTVIAGPVEAVERAIELATARGVTTRRLPVGCAFHTSMVAEAGGPLAERAMEFVQRVPDRPVYSNLDAMVHPSDPQSIAKRLGEHLANPVRFGEMVERMHAGGARVFLEVGPGSVLTSLVDSVLGNERAYLAISTDGAGATGLSAFLRMLARLVTAGVAVRLERLTRGRSDRVLDMGNLPVAAGLEEPEGLTASTWLVNGSRSRPINGAEPRRLGMGPGEAVNGQHAPCKMAKPNGTDSALHAHELGPINGQNSHRGDPKLGRHVTNGKAEHSAPGARASNGDGIKPGDGRNAGVGSNGRPGNHRYAAHQRNGREDLSMHTRAISEQSGIRDRVMESFQETMRAFLDVQKATMLAYMSGRDAGSGSGSADFEPKNSHGEGNGSFGGRLNGAGALNGDHGGNGDRTQESAAVGREAARIESHLGGGEATLRNTNIGPRVMDMPVSKNGKQDPTTRVKIPPAPSVAGVIAVAAGDLIADRAAVTARLLEVVRDRTGYPIETLGLDLDIEADLGIDSIKRVEILGRMRDEFPALKGTSNTAEAMDDLARAGTLGLIVERLFGLAERANRNGEGRATAVRGVAGSSVEPPMKHGQSAMVEIQTCVERRVLEVIEAPISTKVSGLMPGGQVLVTDDGRGVCEDVLRRLRASGIAAERVGEIDAAVDWASSASVTAVMEKAKERRPVAGLIHALPLGQAGSSDGEWKARTDSAVRGLFLMAKAMGSDLEEGAKRGGACLIGATALGGRFGCQGGASTDFFAGHGGVAGLVKTLAREWPTVRCRTVDFSSDEMVTTIGERLTREAMAGDGWSEVGYEQGRRVRARSVERLLDRSTSQLELKPGSPVLITGGARGITAIGALELARTWRPTLLMIGTTPAPVENEVAETKGLTGEAEIKSALLCRLRANGLEGSAVEIEQAYQGLRRTREVRNNLARLREQGVTVKYAAVDVGDREALGRVLNDWRKRHGDPVGLIHGAGMIKDKLIRDKGIDSFDAVLRTKLDGALNLIGLVRPEAIQFTAMFSSIAGRYGNVGQTDYAAANESLSKLAQWLDRRWPGRVVSMVWGPWSGVGMVSQLEGHLGRRGLGMISPETGRSLLVDELRYGKKGEVEVIYTGGLGTLEEPLPIAWDVAGGGEFST